MQAQIPEGPGYFLCRLEGIGNLRLIEVAEADAVFAQKTISGSPVPRGVADLQDEGIIPEIDRLSPSGVEGWIRCNEKSREIAEAGRQGPGFP